ncbi:MAG: RnfABCDGE type electron transport complex subunit G [Thermodesulfobacteriota bacterium]
MQQMIRLFGSVLLFSAVSGGLLAGVRSATQDRIEYQQIQFVKGPAVQKILKGCSNNPLNDRFKIKDGKVERSFFVGVFDGKANTVVFESAGKGYGGDIGIVVAVNLETDKIVGVAVTTHRETPGVGSRTATEPAFTAQFKGNPIKEPFRVRSEGGKIDAVSGATISSRGVTGAVVASAEIYGRLKASIVEKVKTVKT